MARVLFQLKGAFVNFDAMDELGINMQEYAFLESIHQWQKNSGTGWAGPGMANRYDSITVFKNKLGTRCGLSPATTARFILKMKKRGLLEERTNKLRVTDNFRLALKGPFVSDDGEEENTLSVAPSVSQTDGKAFFSDSQFAEFEPFKEFVVSVFPKENLDINHYYEAIKTYYSTENTKAYKNWDLKIMDWIKRQIKDGDVRRIAPPQLSKEQIIKEIATYKGIADNITDSAKYKLYRETIETLIYWTEKAQKANWLSDAQIQRLEELKQDFNTAGALKKRLEKQIIKTSTPTPPSVDDALKDLTKAMSMDG